MWQVQMQFIPGNDQIWVLKLNPNDPIYEYDNEIDAQNQANLLQSQDSTGRQYRIIQVV
jgi:hypothetical protein